RAEGGLPQYLVKGTRVAISGELRVNEYDDKNGVRRTSIEVSVGSLDLIDSKTERAQQPQQPAQQIADPFVEDDLPF
ncbi:MAG: single-stranded DNA-binding protein, partial [Mariprofundales bacterium]|nr:single-stranded DNA-binding protein [Mariprofundales bacterium]